MGRLGAAACTDAFAGMRRPGFGRNLTDHFESRRARIPEFPKRLRPEISGGTAAVRTGFLLRQVGCRVFAWQMLGSDRRAGFTPTFENRHNQPPGDAKAAVFSRLALPANSSSPQLQLFSI